MKDVDQITDVSLKFHIFLMAAEWRTVEAKVFKAHGQQSLLSNRQP